MALGEFWLIFKLEILPLVVAHLDASIEVMQQSLHTPDQEFVLGGLDGDTANAVIGTTPGSLVPGHLYLLDYYFDIVTGSNVDTGASAAGAFTFNFRPGSLPEPISEPAVLALMGLGLAGLGYRRKKLKVA